ncbi:MAG: hypothetical protein CBHOC_4396 [uncultured Caballeronia sp.]|nr:MAG: hypothetical protein CBHOC_4396 [uncultured Caballeronia sp.]
MMRSSPTRHRSSSATCICRRKAIRKLVQVRYTQPENPVLPNVLAPGAENKRQ